MSKLIEQIARDICIKYDIKTFTGKDLHILHEIYDTCIQKGMNRLSNEHPVNIITRVKQGLNTGYLFTHIYDKTYRCTFYTLKHPKVYLVGGAVRDKLLNRPIHDKDYVVVGSTPEEMLSLGYKQVGNEFPVFLHPKTGEEYALARKEISTGDGYRDFKFTFTPEITLKEDLARRDFTINALAQDIETGEIIDYFHGLHALENKKIAHVNFMHFKEDPLRVLRACRFICQLKRFTLAQSTEGLCREMVEDKMLDALTPERVWKEVEKALKTPYFYKFIEKLDDINALYKIFPEVYALKGVPENPKYHPEANTYKHLILVLKQVQNFSLDEEQLGLLNFALLCHDLGKQLTPKSDWPAHHGHDELGIQFIEDISNRLKIPNKYTSFAKIFCSNHMRFYEYLKQQTKTHYDFLYDTTRFKSENEWKLKLMLIAHTCDLHGRQGEISQERKDRCYDTYKLIMQEFDVLEGRTLKDLPEETKQKLQKFNGEQFGKLYRDAMISYLKHGLHLDKAGGISYEN